MASLGEHSLNLDTHTEQLVAGQQVKGKLGE